MRNTTSNTSISTAVIENLESREMFSGSLLTVGAPIGTSFHAMTTGNAGITMNADGLVVSKKAAPSHKTPVKPSKPSKPAKPAAKVITITKPASTTTTTTTTTTVTTPWTIAASQPVIAEPAVSTGGTTYKNFSNQPLFAAGGPTQDDIRQGYVGDCYYLSTLAAIAKVDPSRIQQSIEQLSDGTYVVRVFKGSTAEYVHVDGQLPTWSNGAPVYANLGQGGSVWVAIMEKAFADARTGADSYASLNSGWMTESFGTFGLNSTGSYSFSNSTQLVSTIQSDLAANQAVTIGINTPAQGAPLIGSHAYEVVSVSGSTVTLRNPWGIDGVSNSSNPNDGYVTVTADQLFASQMGLVSAAA
jgi:hypothetical protein